MEKYQICNTHLERVEFASRDFNSNELIGLCVRCLPLPQGVPYQQMNNILISIEKNKNEMINTFEEQKKQNKNIIRKLIDYVKEFKKSQEEKIYQIINQGEFEISKIEKRFQNAQKQISEYNASIDVEELINFYNSLQNNKDLAQTQCTLEAMLQQLQQHSFLFDSHLILQKFPIMIHLDLQNKKENYLQKIEKCPKHNEIVIGVDLSQQQSQLDDLSCLTCIKQSQQKPQITELDKARKVWEVYNNTSSFSYYNINEIIQQLETQCIGKISEKFTKIQNKLNAFLNILQNWKISKLNEQKIFSLQNKLDYNSIAHLQRLKKITKVSKSDWERFEFQINKLAKLIETTTISNGLRKINQFKKQISNIQIDQVGQISTKFIYEQSSEIDASSYRMIAINSEGDILVATTGGIFISVFELNNGVLKPQTSLENIDSVLSLVFMKNKNVFLSGGCYGNVTMWTAEKNNSEWSKKVIIKFHGCDFINLHCLSSTSNDQIISGHNKKVVFLNLDNSKISLKTPPLFTIDFVDLEDSEIQQKIPVTYEIYGFSLNESETKLISFGKSDITVIEQVKQNEWSVVQKIYTTTGCRLCFVTDDIFFVGEIEIFEYSTSQKMFYNSESIEIKEINNYFNSFFPQKFIKQKQLLLSQSNNYVSLIQLNEKGDFNVDYCIELKNEFGFCGTISNDGEYLILFDMQNSKLQVRQCKEIIAE